MSSKPEPTHQQLWDSIQAGEWVKKQSRSYDQDWDDNASTITTTHTWYEHPVWGVRDNLDIENPQDREARLSRIKTIDDRQNTYYAALRKYKNNVGEWDLETFYAHEKLQDWRQPYLEDSKYQPVTNEMIESLAIADLYIEKWEDKFYQVIREKNQNK